ncbi:MAG: chemotaxis protein CheA [bacterium]
MEKIPMEPSEHFHQRIESIATELVLLDSSDPRACTQVYDMLESLGEEPSATDRIRRLAKQAAEIARRLVFGEYNPPETGTKELEDLISLMQTLEEDGEIHDSNVGEETEASASESARQQLLEEFLGRQKGALDRFEKKLQELGQGNPTALATLLHIIATWLEESALLDLPEIMAYLQGIQAQVLQAMENDPLGPVEMLRHVQSDMGELLSRLKIPEEFRSASEADSAQEVKATAQPSSLDLGQADSPTEAPPSASPAGADRQRLTLPSDIDTTLASEFQTEALEHIQNAEVALLNLESNPEDKESVNIVFRAFHTIKGVASFLGLEYLMNLAHSAETLLDHVRKGKLALAEVYADLAFEALDGLKSLIEDLQNSIARGHAIPFPNYEHLLHNLDHYEQMSTSEAQPLVGETARLGEILVESGATSLKAVEEAANQQVLGERRPLGEILVREGSASAKDVAKALHKQKTQAVSMALATQETEGTVKMSTTRLDSLVNMVGELVIAQAMVNQDELVRSSASQNLNRKVTQLSKISRSLQELALSMRMVSVKATFQKVARQVRDLARKSGKEIVLTLEGEETELDRNMVEVIADPLIHLIRNAVDHGIESPEERQRLGKPAAGQILLRAMHEGGGVVISLQDDGRGLDLERIRRKAIERGLVPADAVLSEAEIHRLIFQPGFSTAELVTDVSGRGVGMDVVRSNIEKLRGKVEIQSTPQEGAIFTLRLPLTLAIIDGMVVRVGRGHYIIPTIMITESLRPSRDSIISVTQKGEAILLRGNLIPLYRLYHLFGVSDAIRNPEEAILVVAESNAKRCALMVDDIVDQQQVVIKNLGAMFGRVQGVSGGTIMGDGLVSLILDIEGVMSAATSSS